MPSPNAGPGRPPCPRFSASRRFGDRMPNYRYRALNSNGELVSGAIAAAAPGDVAQRIERLGLVLVDNVTLEEGGGSARSVFSIFNKPKAGDVTIFTRDLALLLRAGGRWRPISGRTSSPAKPARKPCRATSRCFRRYMWR